MDNDRKFNAARGNGGSRARRSAGKPDFSLDAESLAEWPALQEALRNLPDSRPEAVERARRLIADPDYPPQHMEQALADHLAVRLASEIDQLPT